jgi:hypothetical protein
MTSDEFIKNLDSQIEVPVVCALILCFSNLKVREYTNTNCWEVATSTELRLYFHVIGSSAESGRNWGGGLFIH